MAEPIKMPFWGQTRVSPRNLTLDEDPDPPRGRGTFKGETYRPTAMYLITNAFRIATEVHTTDKCIFRRKGDRSFHVTAACAWNSLPTSDTTIRYDTVD